MKRLARIMTLAALPVGGLMVASFVGHIDVSVLSTLDVRFWAGNIAVMLLLQSAIIALHSAQWGLILGDAGIAVRPATIFGARYAGAAVSFLSPGLSIGGDLLRAALVAGPAADRRRAADVRSGAAVLRPISRARAAESARGTAAAGRLSATVVLDKYLELATRLPFVVAGLAILIVRLTAGTGIMIVAAALFAALVFASTALLALLVARPSRAGAFAALLLKPIERLSPATAERARRAFEAFAGGLTLRRPRLLFVLFPIGLLAAATELLQVLILLDAVAAARFADACAVLSAAVLSGAISVLPGNLGGLEAVNVMLLSLIAGRPSAGVVYSLLQRGGQAAVISVGLLYLLYRRLAAARLALETCRNAEGPKGHAILIDGNQWSNAIRRASPSGDRLLEPLTHEQRQEGS